MGIQTVAVYSDADRMALHVQMADEAVRIGAPPARESYLLGERIIEAALKSSAKAIHPGYGFLAENADFAEEVEAAGLIFIGPPPGAIRAMGSKTDARRLMTAAGVPVVPGDQTGLADAAAALKSARRIGYPVLIKAAKGGGGKGMRVVRTEYELAAAFDAARREALSAFGDGEMYLEKYLDHPRHVEIQILADKFGNLYPSFRARMLDSASASEGDRGIARSGACREAGDTCSDGRSRSCRGEGLQLCQRRNS
jgi:acetyl/propionyl-CoA carboxylase alpha subunit